MGSRIFFRTSLVSSITYFNHQDRLSRFRENLIFEFFKIRL